MDDSTESAKKSVRIAEEALRAGDYDKATRFVEKSLRLRRSPTAEDLLKRISIEKLKRSSRTMGSQQEANATQNNYSTSSKRPAQEKTTSDDDKEELVRQIKKAKDHYQVLSIDRSASDEEIKKAYRKLALRLHPDKNKAPGAEEAFKAVSKAFSVLSDPAKRESYDRHGMDDEQMQQRAAASRGAAATYATDIDPEELFRQFFGLNVQRYHFGGFANGFPHHAHTAHNGSRDRRQGFSSLIPLLIQILPIVFIIMSAIPYHEDKPPFMLEKSSAYPILRTTRLREVKYYVQPDFMNKFDRTRRYQIEIDVENRYKKLLQSRCDYERNIRRTSRSQKGSRSSTPSCEAYREKFVNPYPQPAT